MGWAGFSFDCRTEHRVFDEGSPTAIRYRDDIVDPTVSHFAGCIGEDFVLMYDNARSHVTRVVHGYMEEAQIEVLG